MNNALPQEEKLFTKKELENIVEQRLSRERKSSESLCKIRDLVALLRQNEAFKKLSNASLADKLQELVHRETEAPDNAVVKAREARPESFLSCPTFGEMTQNITAEDTQENGYAEEMPETAEQNGFSRFFTKHGEQKLLELMNDSAFRAFCVGKSGDLLELYESYMGFLEALSVSPEAKRRRVAQREFASTGFSRGACSTVDYGSLLTENQKKIAKAAGMSYRQYSELISQIPSKKL